MGSQDESLKSLIIQEAHRIVDKVIEGARLNLLSKKDGLSGGDNGNDRLTETEWFTADEFTVELAQTKIDQFVQKWPRDESWLYCIDFIGEEDFPYDKRYRFRVRWSIPTRMKPIPRATASVYFTIVVSTVKPKSFPVQVFYIFEGNQLVHTPGKSGFDQQWLKNVIESKILLSKQVRF